MAKTNQIKTRRHILFLGVIPSVIFLSIVILSLSWMHKIHLTNAMQADLNSVYRMFYGELYQEAKLITVLAEQLSENQKVQDAFLSNNRKLLLGVARPIFLKNRADHEITHFYFHSLEKTSFLRVYAPDHFGDTIDRFTLNQAEQTGIVSYGLELGKFEGLILRVVIPWRVDGQIVGYIELGKEIDQVIEELKKVVGVDLLLIVDKTFLDQEAWDKERKLRNLADWNQFPDSAVVGMTMTEVPPLIDKYLSVPHEQHDDRIMEINRDNRHYLAGFAPMFDASDKDIGDIIIIRDFTAIKKASNRLTLYLLSGYLVCVLLFMLFVTFYLRHLKFSIKKFIGADDPTAE